MDRYRISYLNCARDLLRFNLPPSSVPNLSIVVAAPDFDFAGQAGSAPETSATTRSSRDLDQLRFPVQPLRGTHEEGVEVARMLGVQPWLGRDAAKPRLKAECRSPRILHLATHGFFLEDEHQELRVAEAGRPAGSGSRVKSAGGGGGARESPAAPG